MVNVKYFLYLLKYLKDDWSAYGSLKMITNKGIKYLSYSKKRGFTITNIQSGWIYKTSDGKKNIYYSENYIYHDRCEYTNDECIEDLLVESIDGKTIKDLFKLSSLDNYSNTIRKYNYNLTDKQKELLNVCEYILNY